MSAIEIVLVVCSAALAAVVVVWFLGKSPGHWLLRVFWLLTLALLLAGLAKLHELLPSEMGVLDQVTFWAVVGTLVLQGVSGILTIATRDLNPAKDLGEELSMYVSVPRGVPLWLETEELPELEIQNNRTIALAMGARLEPITKVTLSKLQYSGASPLSFWYSRTAVLRTNFGQGESVRVYSVRRPFDLEIWDISALQRLLRQVSVLTIAVAGLARFAHDEPILNLFGA